VESDPENEYNTDMALLEIVTVPNPVLRTKAKPVATFDDKLGKLLGDMVETLRAAPGVGLAGPQVNVSQRIIVVEYAEPGEDGEEVTPKLYMLVNPEIVKPSREKEMGIEGCLSIPGFVGEVERSSSVTVRAQNKHGQPVRIKAQGWLARIFQHEVDHLDGVLYTDLATQIWQPEELEDSELAGDNVK
jgi:peptide deformylase